MRAPGVVVRAHFHRSNGAFAGRHTENGVADLVGSANAGPTLVCDWIGVNPTLSLPRGLGSPSAPAAPFERMEIPPGHET